MRAYLRFVFSLTWMQSRKLFLLSFLVIVDTAARLIQPYLYKGIVDGLTDGLVSGSFTDVALHSIIILVAIWFFLAALNNIVNAQSQYIVWYIGTQASEKVHLDGYRRLLRMDYEKHTAKHSSRFAKIIDEADISTWEMTNWWFNRFFPSFVGFVGMLILAFSVSIPMTLVSLAVIPPGLAIIVFMIKRYENEQHRVNKMWNKKSEHLSDQITNIITYKLNQDESLFVKVQREFSHRATIAQTNLNKKWRFVSMLNPDFIARFLVMGMGVYLVKDHSITLGTLFMFMGLLNEILIPLHLLGDILPQYSRRARHIDRYLALLDEKDKVLDPRKSVTKKRVTGKIEFRDVSYAYANSEKGMTLHHISFVIEPGESVAFIGHSGAGKTTISALLNRLVDPTSGGIFLDGIDIRQFKQADYRRFIGAVLQENALYDETIAQNIGYGNPRASRTAIVAASKKAQAHEFIQKLPKGYDTPIGERGVRLSGGEKQRLAIARAILKNPTIVVLDEPTSALDSMTEAKVQKGLLELIEGRTSITIAHRLSTVRSADKIIIMKSGRVFAMGTHHELLRNCPEYQEMVELQTGGFLADK